MSSDQSAPHEIVVVRRRHSGEEEGHHGGAWKIAYADFMTAMMAFFLVMWLVNAADKKVLTQVASYFNPLRMSDRITAEKGVQDLTEGSREQKKEEEQSGPHDERIQGESSKEDTEKQKDKKAEGQGAAANGNSQFSEMEMLNDPYGILEKLAAQAVVGDRGGAQSETGRGRKSDRQHGEAFRDPFDPAASRRAKEQTEEEVAEAVTSSGANSVTNSGKSSGSGKLEEDVPEADVEADAAVAGSKRAGSSAQSEGAAGDRVEAEARSQAAALAQEIERALAAMPPGTRPNVAVSSTEEGILVSLTDEFDFSMFVVSSSQPAPRTVVALKKIAGTLKKLEGPIVVRGHTDGRPFKAGTSDNWRLSSQRALMTRYMLVAGGISEKRFEKIEGWADRQLKVQSDPLAPQNRRIDVLVARVPRT